MAFSNVRTTARVQLHRRPASAPNDVEVKERRIHVAMLAAGEHFRWRVHEKGYGPNAGGREPDVGGRETSQGESEGKV